MTELIERDPQLTQLRECASAAALGVGRVALVSGEAGIGKTSLVKEFVAQLDGTVVWWGSCDALQTPNPLGPLHDIAHSVSASFAGLLASSVKRSTLFNEVIRELQAAGPTVVVIEDAHWADESTFDLLKFIGRRIDRTQALLIVTFREDEVSPSHPLRTVLGDLPLSLTTRIELSGLSAEAVTTLAGRALRSPSGLFETTAGNPFFLTELLRQGGDEVPRNVQDLVLARFARLSPPAREIVQLASIVPARVERWLVDEVLRPEAVDIEQCLDSGLLLADDAALFFRHELARVAVERAMSLPMAEALHARALEALVKRGAPGEYAARLVHHATHANAREAVLEFAPAAARQARERGAHREAAAHYRTALRFADEMAVPERLRLLEAYATESQATNHLDEAIAARRRIVELLSDSGDLRAQGFNQSQLAMVLVVALRNSEGDASSRRAIEILEPLGPSVELAHAYRIEAQLRMINRDCEEAVQWGLKAIELARRFDDRPILAAAYGAVGCALLFLDYDSGCEYLHRGLEIALADELDTITANCYTGLGAISGELFYLSAGERYLRTAIEFTTRKEVDFYRTYALAWQGLCNLFLGSWDDAETHAAEALAGAPRSSTARIMALCALGRLRVRRGQPGGEELLDEALQLAQGTHSMQRIAPVRAARAEAAHQKGDRARVIAEASAVLDLARRHKHRWYVGELSYWLSREGDAPAPPAECAEPYALQLQGRWEEAAEMWARLECPYERARTLCDGSAAARIEALAIFDRLGARVDAENLRKRLRAAGVRGVRGAPRGPRASTQRSPRGLTAREAEVLELLCTGLKNSEIAERLFRSVRTIEHHVDSILGKLGAKSRGEVLAIAHREGLLAKMETGE